MAAPEVRAAEAPGSCSARGRAPGSGAEVRRPFPFAAAAAGGARAAPALTAAGAVVAPSLLTSRRFPFSLFLSSNAAASAPNALLSCVWWWRGSPCGVQAPRVPAGFWVGGREGLSPALSLPLKSVKTRLKMFFKKKGSRTSETLTQSSVLVESPRLLTSCGPAPPWFPAGFPSFPHLRSGGWSSPGSLARLRVSFPQMTPARPLGLLPGARWRLRADGHPLPPAAARLLERHLAALTSPPGRGYSGLLPVPTDWGTLLP